MQSFVVQPASQSSELLAEGQKFTFPWAVIALFLSALLGLAAEIVHWFYRPGLLAASIEPGSWVGRLPHCSVLNSHH